MYPVLVDLNVGFFHTFLQALLAALILMGKTASLSIELLTVTILGKMSLVTSGSSSARPGEHIWTEAEAICAQSWDGFLGKL